MRFYNFINENINVTTIVNLLKKDCKKYINNVEKYKGILISHRKDKLDFQKISIRKNRKPKDTPLIIHNFIDDLFYDKFGVKARSETMFCFTYNFYNTMDLYRKNVLSMSYYGKPYFIFPIGNYKIIYNENIDDLYDDGFRLLSDKLYDKSLNLSKDDIIFKFKHGSYNEELLQDTKEHFKDIIKNYKIKNNMDLSFNKYTEFMLSCNETYIVSCN
jgi:hypothetical protein